MSFITMRDVHKVYAGDVTALRGIDLDVEAGTVRGLLGPNGAGKTTTVKILTTLTRPTRGTATIGDLDVATQAQEVRQIIGASGQYATIDEQLSARQNLMLIARLYRMGDRLARQRTDELLESFTLTAAADRPVKSYSGAMRRRADLAASLVNDPTVLFLDEPTTGLDPAARQGLWEIIRARVAGGTTVLLTTQYLEEADALADRISVIDHGTVIAEGTSDELKSQVGGQRIHITVADPSTLDAARAILADAATGAAHIEQHTVSAQVDSGTQALQRVLAALDAQGIAVHDAGMARPSLDDVFLELTGGKAGDGQ